MKLTRVLEVVKKNKYRPNFHFTPPQNWMNDPNGLVFHEGAYHLFYQHNPFENKWGHMSWGHAVSKDLIHWKHLPVAIQEDETDMIFSGSVVVDWKNTTGIGDCKIIPLIAIYTGHRKIDGQQYQCLAYSIDDGRTWCKYKENPILDINSKNFRDPKVFWFDKQNKWIMLVALPVEKKISIYSSHNLIDWNHLSYFKSSINVEGNWECPDLFPLKLNARTTKWILTLSIIKGGITGGSGMIYFIGDFDGDSFVEIGDELRTPNWIDYGADFYAAVSYSDIPSRDGRRIWLGWMNNWNYADNAPTSPWRGMLSIPRELSLRSIDENIKLIQKPIVELNKLHKREFSTNKFSITEINDKLSGSNNSSSPFELLVEFEPNNSKDFGVSIKNGIGEGISCGYSMDTSIVNLDRTNSGDAEFSEKFNAIHSAPLKLKNGKLLLHLFIDASSIEIFCNDGEVVLSDLIFPNGEINLVELYSDSNSLRINIFSIWEIQNI